jgi:CHASE1-domain containing sensor protein
LVSTSLPNYFDAAPTWAILYVPLLIRCQTQLEPLIVGLFGAVRLVSVRVVTITARAKLVEQRRNLVAEHWGREEA